MCLFNVKHIGLSVMYSHIIIETPVFLYFDMSCNLAQEECMSS